MVQRERIEVIHFLHIGKTGGTAIRHAIAGHLHTKKYCIKLHNHNTTLKDIPKSEKAVFFLRDPISRFVSGFYSRMRQGMPRYFYPWDQHEKEAFEVFSTPHELALSLSSHDKLRKEKANKAMKSIQHVRSSFLDWFDSIEYFESRKSDIFYIGFQESLSNDFDMLKGKLGLPASLSLPIDDIESHRNPTTYNVTLGKEELVYLKQWYANDYEFLDFCKKNASQINNNPP